MYKVILCGSRDWEDTHPIFLTIAGLKAMCEAIDEELVIVHGAQRGADSIAGDIAVSLGIRVIPVPAEWDKYKKGAGNIRNQKMLDEHNISSVYAFRLPGFSPGTDDMASRATSAGLPTYVTRWG